MVRYVIHDIELDICLSHFAKIHGSGKAQSSRSLNP